MTQIDQFESVFRAADKPVPHPEEVRFERILFVTGRSGEARESRLDALRSYLAVLETDRGAHWTIGTAESPTDLPVLLKEVEESPPDLICADRGLQGVVSSMHALGTVLECLTQATDVPVLVLPHPDERQLPATTTRVMVLTDHLTGDDRLVNCAAAFTAPDGRLTLSHVEDAATFRRYVDLISRIPEIDTDLAEETLRRQVLKEPADAIDSWRSALKEAGHGFDIESVVLLGHHLDEHRRLVEERETDLVVMNTKDDDQLAMHGLAHPLAVELRDVPLLML
ncbi:MAG: universal stress protein [Acidobacteriota bacterium]